MTQFKRELAIYSFFFERESENQGTQVRPLSRRFQSMKGATALRCAIMALGCACVYSDDGVVNLSSGVRRGSDQVNFSRCRTIMTLCLVKCYIHMSHKAIYVSSHFSHCSYCLPLSFVPLSFAKQVRIYGTGMNGATAMNAFTASI